MTALYIVRETALRSWLKTIRRPVPLSFSFVQPLLWMLIFGFLFSRFTLGPEYSGYSYLDFVLPGICAMTVLFGASQAGIAIVRDLQTGFLQRMVRSSMHPAWILTGKTVAEVTRLLLQAFVVGQSSTAVSTALPAGSALGVGLTYSMYSSWGRSGPEIALAAVLTGVWNNFVKLGLPIVALALLAFTGSVRPAETLAAAIGVAVLAGAVGLFAVMLRSARLADRVGTWLGRIATAARRIARRPPVQAWGAAAVRFRAQTIDLLEHRWRRLTIATLASHLSLYVVLLLALRHMGVPGWEVTWVEALGAFALVRLVTALPVTPGGLGLVELGLVAALVVAGGARAPVVAAVLVFRFLTLIVQVPLGAASYHIWRARIRRLREGVAPDGDRVAV
jgi:putative heme transporter